MIYILGSNNCMFAVGVSEGMPFIAMREYKDDVEGGSAFDEEALMQIEEFTERGVVIYFDNQVAAMNIMDTLGSVFASAAAHTTWPEKGAQGNA